MKILFFRFFLFLVPIGSVLEGWAGLGWDWTKFGWAGLGSTGLGNASFGDPKGDWVKKQKNPGFSLISGFRIVFHGFRGF